MNKCQSLPHANNHQRMWWQIYNAFLEGQHDFFRCYPFGIVETTTV